MFLAVEAAGAVAGQQWGRRHGSSLRGAGGTLPCGQRPRPRPFLGY